MATDYDAPRVRAEDEPPDDSITNLQTRTTSDAAVLGDDVDPFEAELDLPGASLDAMDLTMAVLPKQSDEFTCSSCYLVRHRSQLADAARNRCRDCAA